MKCIDCQSENVKEVWRSANPKKPNDASFKCQDCGALWNAVTPPRL